MEVEIMDFESLVNKLNNEEINSLKSISGNVPTMEIFWYIMHTREIEEEFNKSSL